MAIHAGKVVALLVATAAFRAELRAQPLRSAPIQGALHSAILMDCTLDPQSLAPARWRLEAPARPDATPSPLAAAAQPAAGGVKLTGGSRLTSPEFELRGLPVVAISALLAPHGGAAAEPLLVEARSGPGEWLPVDRLYPLGRAADQFALWSATLPDPCAGAVAQLRFTAAGSGGDTGWILAEVTAVGYEAGAALRVESAPLNGAAVALGGEFFGALHERPTPFTQNLSSTTVTRLLAPAVADGRVFVSWLCNGEELPAGQRAISIETYAEQFVVAQYAAPRDAPRDAVTIQVLSEPADGVPCWLSQDDFGLCAAMSTPGRADVLAGERVTLHVPPRTEELVFVRWRAADGSGEVGEPALHGAPLADASWLAEFALLGDMNDDGVLDKYDVDPLILAISDPRAYERLFPGVGRAPRGDLNGDGALDERDIEPFVERLLER